MIYPIKTIKAADIATACGGRLIYGSADAQISSVSIDSRTVSKDSLFIPIKGSNFEGHDFIDDVCQQGIGGYLCSNGHINEKSTFAIMVDNTRKALVALASFYRDLFDLRVVGLTGSVGKTTTKEFIANVLKKNFSTHFTQGNFNNDIGVSLTLFGVNDQHNAAVVEMGMSDFGEIDVLTRCAKPDIAVITNIGTSHIEYLGSREGILKAKSEIFNGLPENGSVILNGDDPYLQTLRGKLAYDVTFVGIENSECDIIADSIVSDENGSLFKVNGREYRINFAGIHNIYNALCAIAVGQKFSMSYEKIYAGLRGYLPDGIRQNLVSANGYKVLNDCYNASPQSVMAMLEVLKTISGKRKIAVLGDMAELGKQSESLHREVGRYAAKQQIDVLVTVGKWARYIAKESGIKNVFCFETVAEAVKLLKDFVREDDVILVKASRSMKFEQISDELIDG